MEADTIMMTYKLCFYYHFLWIGCYMISFNFNTAYEIRKHQAGDSLKFTFNTS